MHAVVPAALPTSYNLSCLTVSVWLSLCLSVSLPCASADLLSAVAGSGLQIVIGLSRSSLVSADFSSQFAGFVCALSQSWDCPRCVPHRMVRFMCSAVQCTVPCCMYCILY